MKRKKMNKKIRELTIIAILNIFLFLPSAALNNGNINVSIFKIPIQASIHNPAA
ncbi:MAG: hypothetical protein ACI8SR_002092 [Oceanicoccus sp.]|jgi:hypothetical protein